MVFSCKCCQQCWCWYQHTHSHAAAPWGLCKLSAHCRFCTVCTPVCLCDGATTRPRLVTCYLMDQTDTVCSKDEDTGVWVDTCTPCTVCSFLTARSRILKLLIVSHAGHHTGYPFTSGFVYRVDESTMLDLVFYCLTIQLTLI